MLPFLLVAAVAALVTAVCSAGVLRLSRRFQLTPEVRERDVHKQPTPRLGGIAMFIGILVALIYAVTHPMAKSHFLYLESRDRWKLQSPSQKPSQLIHYQPISKSILKILV